MKQIPAAQFNSATPEQFQAILQGPADVAARWLYTAAEYGSPEAQVRYGQMLLQGSGVASDIDQAFQWFRQAANKGHAMAMNMAGRCYENGWGVPVDMLLATYWFRLAAQAGLDWGMYNYATSLALGRGVAIERHEALRWLRKATALGHAKSWNLLGGFYEDGWEVEPDPDVAIECYRKAARGGDFRGQFNAGRLLAAQGKRDEAAHYLVCAWSNPAITKAFQEKMRGFLKRHGDVELLTIVTG